MGSYAVKYYLQDDTVEVAEIHSLNDGKDPFPLLLKRTKLPKNWKETPGKTQKKFPKTSNIGLYAALVVLANHCPQNCGQTLKSRCHRLLESELGLIFWQGRFVKTTRAS